MGELVGVLRRMAASLVRHGDRTVLHGYPSLGLGNYLYFLLHAHVQQRRGFDYRVVRPELMDYWSPYLPQVQSQLTVTHESVRVRDRRDEVPVSFFQGFGSDFTREELIDFVTRFVISAYFCEDIGLDCDDILTVNVRRGDYYAAPAFRKLYGFDVATYVRIALEEAMRRDGPVRRIHVVSDGIDWCRSELSWLGGYAAEVTYADRDAGPARDLLEIAHSRRLVITNSTFSYWGAYISNVLHEDNHGQVFAPRFHSRGVNEGRAWQLDPLWSVVETLPDGWGPPPESGP